MKELEVNASESHVHVLAPVGVMAIVLMPEKMRVWGGPLLRTSCDRLLMRRKGLAAVGRAAAWAEII